MVLLALQNSLIEIAIATGGGIASLLTGIYHDRPRVQTNDLRVSINYETLTKIEEKEFVIKWGHVDYKYLPWWVIVNEDGVPTTLFSNIRLTDIPKNANIELTFFRFGRLEEYLPNYAFTTVNDPWDDMQKVYLGTRKFYTKQNITKVHGIIRTEIDDAFTNYITYSLQKDYIEIRNNNAVKIINYTVDLPHWITRESIDESNSDIDDIKNIQSDITHEIRLRLIIREIPERKPDQPGLLKIPFKVPIPF